MIAEMKPLDEAVKKRNFRTGLLLAVLAAAFFFGFMAKFTFLR